MFQAHIRVLARHAANYLPPEARTFQNIGLIDGSYFTAALSRQIECQTGNPAHLAFRVRHRIDGLLLLDLIFSNPYFSAQAGLAKIHITRQLAYHQQIDTLQMLRLEWRSAHQAWVWLD